MEASRRTPTQKWRNKFNCLSLRREVVLLVNKPVHTRNVELHKLLNIPGLADSRSFATGTETRTPQEVFFGMGQTFAEAFPGQ